MPETFQCDICLGVFQKAWTDEEADAELARNFPGFTKEQCAVVCHECCLEMELEGMIDA